MAARFAYHNPNLVDGLVLWAAITGGNHAQFGWYGGQSGDGTATISREEQRGASLLHSGEERRFEHGHSFPLSELGPFHQPLGEIEVPAEVGGLVYTAQSPTPSEAVPSPLGNLIIP